LSGVGFAVGPLLPTLIHPFYPLFATYHYCRVFIFMYFLHLVESIKTTTVTPLQQRYIQSDPTRERVESEIYPSVTVPAPYTPLDTMTPRAKVAKDDQHEQSRSNNPPTIASIMSEEQPNSTDSIPPSRRRQRRKMVSSQ
jgi:hypothetical protein